LQVVRLFELATWHMIKVKKQIQAVRLLGLATRHKVKRTMLDVHWLELAAWNTIELDTDNDGCSLVGTCYST